MTPSRKFFIAVQVAFAVQFGFLMLSWLSLPPAMIDYSFSRLLSSVDEIKMDEKDTKRNMAEGRPLIYTFYYPIPMDVRHTDMSEYDDATLLKTWEITWHDAGWEPKILSMEDARQHPNFDRLYHTILGKRFSISIQEEMQYLKYLAMASTYKGGWYADYDVFPLYMEAEHKLPNGGNFTMYDGYMSSLLSGTASEWDRIGTGLIEFVGKKLLTSNGAIGNSLEAMQQYWPQISETTNQTNEVLRLEPIEKIKDCKPFKNRRAVHFAFWKIPNSRSREGYLLLQQWRQTCQPENFSHLSNHPKHPSPQIIKYTNADAELMNDYYGDGIKH